MQLPAVVADYVDCPRFTAYGENDAGEFQRFVLEGGSIDVNGAGCVLTTEECLLSEIQQRNPGFSRDRIEKTLCDFLGVSKVLWLNHGIAGDDTHGHIDDTARFTNPTTIVACVEPNKSDDNHAPMKENLARLKKMRDAQGKQFTIAELPLPAPVDFRKPAPPRLLRQFLHRQLRRPRPRLQRPQRHPRPQNPRAMFPRPPHHPRLLPRPGLGPRNPPLHDATTTHVPMSLFCSRNHQHHRREQHRVIQRVCRHASQNASPPFPDRSEDQRDVPESPESPSNLAGE